MRRIPLAVLALLLLLTASAHAARRHRAARPPSNPDILVPQDPSSVAGWLRLHGHALSTPEYFSTGRSELEPLRGLVGDAKVVGLGDATHGTREFYTVKLRIIDFLVREMGFDTLVMEAPVPQFERLNRYVLGGAGDPRAVLKESSEALGYHFWDTEEVVTLLDWMRAYNQTRGASPPLQLFGGDIVGQADAWKDVVAYLQTVDTALAATAQAEYACIGERPVSSRCEAETARVRDAMLAAQANLIARSSRDAFYHALYKAVMLANGQDGFTDGRDKAMADDAIWVRDHMSATRRVIFWAHNAHVSRNEMTMSLGKTAGMTLAEQYGDDYFVIGTLTGAGSFNAWNTSRTGQVTRQVVTFNPIGPSSHEANLSQRGTLPFLLPLRGELPSWLTAALEMNASAASSTAGGGVEVLPDSFDAIVYIPRTTPTRVLNP